MPHRPGTGLSSAGSWPAWRARPFPLLAISEIAGWPAFETLTQNRELWTLNRRAQAEIMRLKQRGWIGRLMSWLTPGLPGEPNS